MKWVKSNSLCLVFFAIFLISLVGQAITGLKEYNQKMKEDHGRQVSFTQYLGTGHFIETTFENWESEFLQMALFVMLTIFLYQRGSSESKDPDGGEEEVDKEPNPRKKDAPWPVKQGGWVLAIYKNSLSIAFLLLFLLSFALHFYGSFKDYNLEQSLKGKHVETAMQYLGDSKFWFESFQNWQSEFLSVLAVVFLSIYLRQKGSPQSKPVDAPHLQTGE